MNYIDLHIHTKYTVGNGITKIEDLVRRARVYDMEYLAITDSGSIKGFNEFKSVCKNYGITPIFGCGFYFAPLGHDDKITHHLVLIAMNDTGYNNLLNLDRVSNENDLNNKPRITWEELSQFKEGLICFTGGLGGVFDKPFLNDQKDLAYENIEKLKGLFHKNFYLELQDNGQEKNSIMKKKIPQVSKELNIDMIVTGGSFYLDSSDSEECNKIREENGNKTLKGDKYNFKSPTDIVRVFEGFKTEIERSFLIAKNCKVTII